MSDEKDTGRLNVADTPADLPPPPDQAEWDAAAQQFLVDSLGDVQASADKWSTALGALLGVFGTVALVAGPSEIGSIPGTGWRLAILALVVAAGVLAGAALYLAAVAQMRPSPASDNWNGVAYQVYVIANAQRATRYLNASRIIGVIAAAVVFLTGLVAMVNAAFLT